MTVEKPVLKVSLLNRKQKLQPGLVLDIQNEHAVILSELPQSVVARKGELSNALGQGIKQQIQDPIEHFDQKGEFG